ncbi:MAG: peptide deformylase [Myxococcota bacterium]|nr:peptide deformylase [Myxococcota bacterium]
MAIRKICIWPDPALAEIAQPVTQFDSELKTLVLDLFDTMYEANGVGLAATQVAVNLRVLVIDLDPNNSAEDDPEVQEELESFNYNGPKEFINPEIRRKEGSLTWEEGCLSVPGYTDKVERAEHVTVRAQNREGETFELAASGLYAVAIQHEMDHLVGKVFVEYSSRMKRDMARKKMVRLKSSGIDDGVVAAANL